MTKEQLAEEYANSIVPNPDKHDAPYYTTRDKHEDLEAAFIKGYEANQSKWISVEDALPDYGVNVLVVGESKGMNPSMGGAYIVISQRQNLKGTALAKDTSRHQCDNQFRLMNYVTHWQPLPPKP